MKKEKGKKSKRKETAVAEQKSNFLAWILFLGYLLLLFYMLFFSETFGRTDEVSQRHYNLTLFKEIKRFWYNWETVGIENAIINLGGNIVAFAPFGFFLPLICNRGKNPCYATMMTALFSLSVETVQLISMVGAFDVDDIFLNTIGGLLGYIGYEILFGRRKQKADRKKARKQTGKSRDWRRL